MNVMIVGAGQLGSRHLQACVKIRDRLNILVIDQSVESLKLAESRAKEVSTYGYHNVTFCSALENIAEKFDIEVLILATGAESRFSILDDILCSFKVKHAVLEKVLFQDLHSYDLAASLLMKNGVNAYVNCPLRTYPFFERVKAELFNRDLPVSIKYRGGEWVGLACNSIHYIDLLRFLSSSKVLRVDVSGLDEEIIPSKRVGNIEFTGGLVVDYSDGSKLFVQSIKGSQEESIIMLGCGGTTIEIEELTGNFTISVDGTIKEVGQYDLVYQSDLTKELVESLINFGTCCLTTYEESSTLHRPFIEALLEFYTIRSGVKQEHLPIT
ncbi:Predicted dehydrogenase [Alteromonadaceae bacterium Bs31]|nr:Predicted dehydrogenase [Alteromonadaceae bacterium Bs31]